MSATASQRGNHDWYTPEEDAAIIAQWPAAPLRQLTGVIDRSAASIENRAQKLVKAGVLSRANRFYMRPWSEADDDLLRDQYGAVADATLAQQLGRSAPAVRCRAFLLGVRKGDVALSGLDVARILGIDSHAIRPLIERGLLAATRAPYERGRKRVWLIAVEAVERFLRDCPEWYDRRRIVEEPWLSLARAAYRADPVLTPTEAARLLGVAKETVMRHCREGWLQATAIPSSGKYGREWRIRRSTLTAFRPRNLGGAWRASLGGSIAQQNGQRKHKAKPRRPVVRFRTQASDRERRTSATRFRPVEWRAS